MQVKTHACTLARRHTHTHMHAGRQAHTYTHARTHARTHTHTHTHTQNENNTVVSSLGLDVKSASLEVLLTK